MGFFGEFAYRNGSWRRRLLRRGPYLTIDVHDSDLATVRYAPHGDAAGVFFLGSEPRVYFDDEDLHEPVDRHAEAQAFANWLRATEGREVDVMALMRFLPRPVDIESEDVFVEETVVRFLDFCGIPVPKELAR